MARLPDESKKQKILQTASVLFGSLGYKDTTIIMVAEKADIAAGSIYTYFESKKNLYRNTIRYLWQLIDLKIEEIIYQNSSFEKKVQTLCGLGIELLLQSTTLLLGIYDSTARRKSVRKHLEKICWKLLPLFKIETAPKQFRKISALDTVYFLSNYISGIIFQYLLMTSPIEQKNFLTYAWQKIEAEIMCNHNLEDCSSNQDL